MPDNFSESCTETHFEWLGYSSVALVVLGFQLHCTNAESTNPQTCGHNEKTKHK